MWFTAQLCAHPGGDNIFMLGTSIKSDGGRGLLVHTA
jgi:hypothetical protein